MQFFLVSQGGLGNPSADPKSGTCLKFGDEFGIYQQSAQFGPWVEISYTNDGFYLKDYVIWHHTARYTATFTDAEAPTAEVVAVMGFSMHRS